jgi:hypothetical protein
MDAGKLPRLNRQQRGAALEKARADRLEREARGEHEPLDEWPDGPPEGDEEAMARYTQALRQWYERHADPPTALSPWSLVRARPRAFLPASACRGDPAAVVRPQRSPLGDRIA